MARVCIVFGFLLCGLTMAGLILSVHKNPAHFVPLVLGIPILFCGVVGLNPHRLVTTLKFALGIATAGVMMGAISISVYSVRMGRDLEVNMFALKVVSVMSFLCLVFAVLCVFSIIRGCRRRLGGIGLKPGVPARVQGSGPRGRAS